MITLTLDRNGFLRGSWDYVLENFTKKPPDPRPITEVTEVHKALACHVHPGIIPQGYYSLKLLFEDNMFLGTVVEMTFLDSGVGSVRETYLKISFDDISDIGMDASKESFFLTAERMPMRNNVVVQYGFSDLVEALKSGWDDFEVYVT